MGLVIVAGDKDSHNDTMASQLNSTVFVGVAGTTISGIFVPDDPFGSYNQGQITKITGERGVADGQPSEEPTAPAAGPAPGPAAAQDTAPGTAQATAVGPCSGVSLDYEYQLSQNFKLKDFSIACLYKHKIAAQHGLTVSDIICNLQSLAQNCIEPIRAKYPGVRINSGFRTSTGGTSQHERGQACDMQWPGASYDTYWNMIQWIKNNIDYDQLIYEYGNTVWIHCSFNRAGNRSKSASNAVMTMKNGHYTSGLHRYA